MTTTQKPPLRAPPKAKKEPAFPTGKRVVKIDQPTDSDFFLADIEADVIRQPYISEVAPIGTKGTFERNETLTKGAVLVRFDGYELEAFSPLDALRCLAPVSEGEDT